MKAIISNQRSGGLHVVQITRSGTIRAKFNSEFCVEGPHSAVQKILRFEFRKRSYLALARKNGFVQLFESGRRNQANPVTKISFKLFKEWKNACVSTLDSIVMLGVAHGRFLYSCSTEGKLIFRDLLNDDSDTSNRIFLVQKPVSAVEVRDAEPGVVQVVCAGKGNPVKKYCVDLNRGHQDHGVRRSDICCNIIGHGGTNWWNGGGDTSTGSDWSYAVPTWSVEGVDDWIISTVSVEKTVICGTQNGTVLLFKDGASEVGHRVNLSHFPIRDLAVHGLYVVCHDSMSKVFLLDQNLAILRVYDGLKIGPVSSCKYVFDDLAFDRRRKVATLVGSDTLQMFVVTTNLENRMVIYKLEATAEMVLNMELHSGAPCFDILGHGSNFALLQEICGEAGMVPNKRRQLWQPLGMEATEVAKPRKAINHEL